MNFNFLAWIGKIQMIIQYRKCDAKIVFFFKFISMKSLKANQVYLFYRKYVFKIIEKTPRGNQTTMLYAGTLDEVKVVFPVGEFHLFAEIHEEAGAYATYDINIKFPTTLVSF